MEDFSLRTLGVLEAVAAHRSFRGAARELSLPPSSVSHIVADVERRLGIRLFLRSTRSVALTEAGEAFLTRVRPALVAIAQAIEGVNELRDRPTGLVRINASAWGAERLLPIVVSFLERHPEIRVDLVTEGRLVDIIAEGFDAGLRLESVVPQDMIAVPLGVAEALIVVGAPGYLARRGTPGTPGDLLAHECIRARLPSGALVRWEMSRGQEEIDVAVTGRLIVGTTALSARAAADGLGLAYVDVREAEPFLVTGELMRVLSDWTPSLGSEALYYPAQRLPSAAFRAFVAHVREQTAARR